MAPIRIGFIGLSSGQSWAVWAHLPYLKNSTKYDIVALCNSSLASAQKAIQVHGLPSTTKAYGTPEELAADPDVDLVVCSIRVDMHYDALVPVLKAGKQVYCEWPLEKNTARAQDLLSLAQKSGAKTLVGIQAAQSPALNKVKQLLDSGKIGRVLSSDFYATSTFFNATDREHGAYQHDITVGGNQLTIYASHALSSLRWVLGDFDSFNSVLNISHPEVDIVDNEGNSTRRIPRTSHDEILLQGKLESGAVLSYHLRGGPAFAGTNGLTWSIYGTEGEIRVTGAGSFLHISDDDVKIEVSDHKTGKTETVTVDKDQYSNDVLFSRNVARLYESFADGKGKADGVYDFEDAVKRHQFVDEVYAKAGVV